MMSVVIAAHNEGSVIGRCLDALLAEARPGEFEVIVVANGCDDETASAARSRLGVQVIEVPEANKSIALNRGDAAATMSGRVYLDADIVVTTHQLRLLRDALLGDDRCRAASAALAVVPDRHLDVSGRPWLVTGYFAISGRLPAFREGLFGRGLIGLNSAGRARFDRFPDLVADDLFLDSLFRPDEKVHLTSFATVVSTPRTTHDLVRRLVRVRRGNAQLRRALPGGEASPANVRPAKRWSWLLDVVIPRPSLTPAAFAYVGITVTASFLARRSRQTPTWGQDRSTRDEVAGQE